MEYSKKDLIEVDPTSRIEALMQEPTLRQARVISSKLNIDPAIVLGV